MSESKVKIPKKVAEAIEQAREVDKLSNYGIFEQSQGINLSPKNTPIFQWAFSVTGDGSPDLLMQALVNGYEIERNPHEELRKYYEELKRSENGLEYRGLSGSQFRQGWQSVEETLSILGITVEGINDQDGQQNAKEDV